MKTQEEINDFLYQNTEFECKEIGSNAFYYFDKNGNEIGFRFPGFHKILVTNNRKWSAEFMANFDQVYQIKRGYKELIGWEVVWNLHSQL